MRRGFDGLAAQLQTVQPRSARRRAVRLSGKHGDLVKAHDRLLYRKRHRIENMYGKLKDWRRVHTRYDRCAHTFMSAICMMQRSLSGWAMGSRRSDRSSMPSVRTVYTSSKPRLHRREVVQRATLPDWEQDHCSWFSLHATIFFSQVRSCVAVAVDSARVQRVEMYL